MSDTDTATAQSTPDTAQTDAETTPQQCGFLVPQGTEEGGQKVTKPCVKTPGHDGPHSSRVYNKIDTSAISLDMLAPETVPSGEKVEGLTERTRDEVQQKVDADVLAAHKQWTEAGKPSGFNEAIAKGAGQRYFINPEHAAAFRSLLRRAAAFHTAEGTPIHVRIIPPKRHQDGRTMLYWIATDKRENKKADDKKPAEGLAAEAEAVRNAAQAMSDDPKEQAEIADKLLSTPPTLSAEEAAEKLGKGSRTKR